MKKLILAVILTLLVIPSFAINCYSLTYTINGKRNVQTFKAFNQADAKTILYAQYPSQKVSVVSIKSIPNGDPVPIQYKDKTSRPVMIVTFKIDGRRTEQHIYAYNSGEAKYFLKQIYRGHTLTFLNIKRKR